MKKPLLLTIFLLSAAWSYAQDVLVKKNAEEIKVKILEITPDLVKYIRFDNQAGPVISVQKQEVSEIRYENGAVENFAFVPEPVRSESPKPLPVRKNTLSLNILPVFNKSFNVFYDRRLEKNPNIGLSLGLGVYFRSEDFFGRANDQLALTGAAKFYIQESDFYLSPYLKYRHVSQPNTTYLNPYQQKTYTITWDQFGGGATFGMQHVFNSGFLIDSFMGLGGYALERRYNPSSDENYYSPANLDVRLGIALGFAF